MRREMYKRMTQPITLRSQSFGAITVSLEDLVLEDWTECGYRYEVCWKGGRGRQEYNSHLTNSLKEAERVYAEWCVLAKLKG
jgi:hypothetical protein